MKKKTFFLSSKLWCLGALALSLLATSCAQDGFDDETYKDAVENTQLTAIPAEEINVKQSADGTMMTISWPVVHGAGGYHAILTNLTSEELVKDTVIDGVSFAAAMVEENNYSVSLQVLGNEEKNNTGAEAVTKFFDTFVVALATIPSNTDLYEYFQENDVPESEGAAVYDLEENGTYTLSKTLDFGTQYVMLRTSGDNALITCSNGAYFMFGNGIKLQNVNIDNTDNTANGLFTMSDNPSEALSIKSLGYKGESLQNGYVMTNPVYLKNVNVKGLQKTLIYGNEKNWSVLDMIIEDCIIQLNNESSMGVINLAGASNGLIKNLSVKGNTFYNLKANTSAYFLRYSNASNAQPKKIYGDGATAQMTMANNTLAYVFTGKDFANQLPTVKELSVYMTDNIFYDVYQIYRFFPTNSTLGAADNNYIWWTNADSKQTNDSKYATEADPGFPAMEALSPLDFSAPNCGVDFTPSGVPFDNMAGDPRWLPEN